MTVNYKFIGNCSNVYERKDTAGCSWFCFISHIFWMGFSSFSSSGCWTIMSRPLLFPPETCVFMHTHTGVPVHQGVGNRWSSQTRLRSCQTCRHRHVSWSDLTLLDVSLTSHIRNVPALIVVLINEKCIQIYSFLLSPPLLSGPLVSEVSTATHFEVK